MILSQLKILVTRPQHQAENLCNKIAAEGGQPIRLPAIDIVDIEDKTVLQSWANRLEEANSAIFISANAVEKSLPVLLAQRNQPLPAQLQLIAVGKKTAATLQRWGLTAISSPPPYNSEAILSMAELQPEKVNNQNILIFRGEGGRELLADALRQRGAMVHYVHVYRRIQPAPPAIPIEPVDIITVTSQEAMQNLFNMLAEQEWLRQTPYVVISERVMAEAKKLGVQAPIVVAPAASDDGLLQGLFLIVNC
jgi:uroporphyrinogen-III synthase